jgi:hypothetical protein
MQILGQDLKLELDRSSFVVAIYAAHHVDGLIMGLKAGWWFLIMFMIENCLYIYMLSNLGSITSGSQGEYLRTNTYA